MSDMWSGNLIRGRWRSPAGIGGLQIMPADHLTEPYEDWTRVRSPARARRRMKRGHRQNIIYGQKPQMCALQVGNTILMHPLLIDLLKRELRRRDDKRTLMTLQMGELGALLADLGFGPRKDSAQGETGT